MANDIWRSTLSSHLQTIQSHYYNITDSESWPVAGLLVLLDSNGQPVRSELHLYEDLPSHIQEAAVRQSRLVLQERYHGANRESALVPLRILHTAQIRAAMDVRLNPVEPEAPTTGDLWARLPWPGIALAGALVVLALLVWGGLALFRPGTAPDTPTQAAAALEAPAVATAADDPLSPAPEQEDAPVAFPPPAVEAGQLPPSRNAREDIRIGMRVRILPGFSLTLRSEAGARAGEEVGYLTNEAEALVVGGPLLTQGETDTIVWWLVELEDGMQAWAAANTSQTTLLVPAD